MKVTKEQVVLEIDKFLAGEGGGYDWDDFCSIRIEDLELNNVRILCADLPIAYPRCPAASTVPMKDLTSCSRSPINCAEIRAGT